MTEDDFRAILQTELAPIKAQLNELRQDLAVVRAHTDGIPLLGSAIERGKTMDDFKQYRRNQISELRPFVQGEDLTGVSITEADKLAGSPKVGDWIARNPNNHDDKWLMAEKYFKGQNFKPV
jgi:hypothetical protein